MPWCGISGDYVTSRSEEPPKCSVESIQQSYLIFKLRIFQASIHNFILFDTISVAVFH
jgi:hypothetical protein